VYLVLLVFFSSKYIKYSTKNPVRSSSQYCSLNWTSRSMDFDASFLINNYWLTVVLQPICVKKTKEINHTFWEWKFSHCTESLKFKWTQQRTGNRLNFANALHSKNNQFGSISDYFLFLKNIFMTAEKIGKIISSIIYRMTIFGCAKLFLLTIIPYFQVDFGFP